LERTVSLVPQLKVVHISTSITGGAGIAAYRLHKSLLQCGIDSSFLYLDQPSHSIDLQNCFQLQAVSNATPSVLRYILNKFPSKIKNIFLSRKDYYNKKLANIAGVLKCEMISLPFSNYNILEHSKVKEADIIHLHWVSGMLDYPSFFKKNTKTVTWTLHDMNPFRGIYHYKDDETRNEHKTFRLDTAISKIKKSVINKRKSKLSIVCPSDWLLSNAIESNMFDISKGYCIRNPIDTKTFYREDKTDLRTTLNIPKENTIFLFIAQSVANHRKGFDILLGALEEIKQLPVTLLVIGNDEGRVDIPELDIRILGIVEDNVLLRNYYSLASAFIIPSREDNLPNVMLEAMACGTPVLSFNVGGMAEIIYDYFNGLKSPAISIQSLVDTLVAFIQQKEKFDSAAIRAFAVAKFSDLFIAKQYISLYQEQL
jgi:glycosyltransferase involved in cell wall biosynthesis